MIISLSVILDPAAGMALLPQSLAGGMGLGVSQKMTTSALGVSLPTICGCGGLKMLGRGSGTMMKCGLVGVGVTLLEEVWHIKCGL